MHSAQATLSSSLTCGFSSLPHPLSALLDILSRPRLVIGGWPRWYRCAFQGGRRAWVWYTQQWASNMSHPTSICWSHKHTTGLSDKVRPVSSSCQKCTALWRHFCPVAKPCNEIITHTGHPIRLLCRLLCNWVIHLELFKLAGLLWFQVWNLESSILKSLRLNRFQLVEK